MKSRTLTGIFLFIFWCLTTAIITAGLIVGQKNNGSTSNGTDPATGSLVTLTTQEVTKHNTASDCWSIVNDKVYALTPLISTHSGGDQTITRNCGKDGTQDYVTKGKTPPKAHNPGDINIMANYLLGDLNSTANVEQKMQQINSTPAIQRDEDEDDDD